MRRALLVTALLLLGAFFAAACGDAGGDDQGTASGTETPSQIAAAQVATSDLVVGRNRLALGLFDQEQNLVLRAQVQMRLFKIEDEGEVAKGEATARYVSLRSNFVHEHEDGTRHVHSGDEVGLYVAEVEFDSPGIWAADVQAAVNGRAYAPVRTHFEVKEDSPVPNVGELAPATRQVTLADVQDIEAIDTSPTPDPEMHQMTVADASASGRPTVVAFTTPAFCVSRICGPVKSEVVDPLFEEFRDRVNFIHIEPYDLEQARAGGQLVPVPAMQEWGLQTEPWVFVIDAQGRIAARFEGLLAADELRAAIEETLG